MWVRPNKKIRRSCLKSNPLKIIVPLSISIWPNLDPIKFGFIARSIRVNMFQLLLKKKLERSKYIDSIKEIYKKEVKLLYVVIHDQFASTK